MGLVNFEYKKMDKEKIKLAVSSLAAGALAGFSGIGAGAIVAITNAVVTGINAEIDHWLAQVTILAGPVDAATVTQYLNQFPGLPADNIKFVQDNPKLLAKLKARDRRGNPVFSQEQQEKILANIDWLVLLMEVAPIILKILLMFI